MAVQFSGQAQPSQPAPKPSGGCGCGSNERRADDKPKVVVASKRPKR
jgi:hypothetical protein